MGYELVGWGSILGLENRFFIIPHSSDWFSGLFRLLSNGYWGLFPADKAAGA
jgi:hypothetical protein